MKARYRRADYPKRGPGTSALVSLRRMFKLWPHFLRPSQMSIVQRWKDHRHEQARSRLLDAFDRNDAKLVHALVQDHPDLANQRDGAGRTLVHRMLVEDRSALIGALSQPGVDWSLRLPDGRSVLHLAVASRQTKWLSLALAREDDIPLDCMDNLGRTALHHAAVLGLSEIIRQLDGAGADWAVADRLGKTPLSLVQGRVLHASWRRRLVDRGLIESALDD